ncbi:NAD(P)-binding protein [Sciscionella marina]|uniref:oxidoreductase n=1 Tax=Sciscionella marina TaxID=508770 RepID=UPI00036BB996|nr:NAD(P)-binding protein [Sciscionella marina]
MQPERDPRYDILFTPVTIGPVTARNRFFQVPHCNGMGYRDPTSEAFMRAVKAEGGWAVVCTEEAEIHPSADLTPSIELRLWDEQDVPAAARIADKIHEHGGLAGIELAHGGMHSSNLTTRGIPLGPSALPVTGSYDPVQSRVMTLADIEEFRGWHRDAVRRALRAGFDLVYVYAGHGLTNLHQFLSPRYNQRSDEYGGGITNRMRLLREVLEDTRELCAGRAAVACRLGVGESEMGISRGDTEEIVGSLAELPDVWDFQAGSWEQDSNTSRFGPEGEQEHAIAGLKRLTTKPVVGVGRFTSPDAMVRQIREGILDFIGAARPSIADPFLPNKIREGRLAEIRECIGCNICVSGDYTNSPIRCTQNPSMGEEWRRGWHPERLRAKRTEARIVVLGAGPAGLEATTSLGRRGYPVTLLEQSREIGGRVRQESRLPGLSAWIRVVDYREQLLDSLSTVECYRESPTTSEDILEFGFDHAVIATGSAWRADGVGRSRPEPLPIDPATQVLTPDDLMRGTRPAGSRVLLYDDDHYYLGGVLAELLAREGYQVELVTPAANVSEWTANTMETSKIRRRLASVSVQVSTHRQVTAIHTDSVTTACVFTGEPREHAGDAIVLVTARTAHSAVYDELLDRHREWAAAGLRSVRVIGDGLAPGTIAAAIWSGRYYAENLDTEEPQSFRREVTQLALLGDAAQERSSPTGGNWDSHSSS